MFGKILATILVSIGGPILNVILNIFKAGALRRLAAWTTIIGLLSTLFVGINVLLSAFTYIMPDYVSIGMSWIIPDNFTVCVTTYLAASALITLYKWHRRGIQLALCL